MQTKFNKEDFTWDGMYLMYTGEHSQSKYYELPCHPTRVGTPRSEFIARFKYGYKPWKAWVNFLVKHATVEQYMELSTEPKYGSPVKAMVELGYNGKV